MKVKFIQIEQDGSTYWIARRGWWFCYKYIVNAYNTFFFGTKGELSFSQPYKFSTLSEAQAKACTLIDKERAAKEAKKKKKLVEVTGEF